MRAISNFDGVSRVRVYLAQGWNTLTLEIMHPPCHETQDDSKCENVKLNNNINLIILLPMKALFTRILSIEGGN